MTGRPIIFSAPMVRALLEGRKTQTRRLATSPLRKCSPGDVLWVRESWADVHPLAVQVGRYSQEGRTGIPGPPPVDYRTIYRADGEPLQVWRNHGEHPYFTLEGPASEQDAAFPTVCSNFTRGGKSLYWTPSIYMPRWASRLTLAVSAVRIEPLQKINGLDALAEGITPVEGVSPWRVYLRLWNSLHGEGAWQKNPEVVALTFTVHKQNVDDFLRQHGAT